MPRGGQTGLLVFGDALAPPGTFENRRRSEQSAYIVSGEQDPRNRRRSL